MNTETELNQLDNPTEWEAIVGTAILDPARTSEMSRKAEIKLAVESRIFCDCGSILDQQTAVGLVDKAGRVRSISCPACMKSELRKSLKKMVERYGTDHTRETITQDFSLISWTSTTTGAEIWSTYSAPAPRRPKKPKTEDKWLTPAQIQDVCHGWTFGAGLVVSAPFIMAPNAQGRRKLEKRAPNGIQNHERFASIVDQSRQWLALSLGSKLTIGETKDNGKRTITELLREDGSFYCHLDTIRMKTVEHYCGQGSWYEAPESDSMQSPRFGNTPHAACGLCARMD